MNRNDEERATITDATVEVITTKVDPKTILLFVNSFATVINSGILRGDGSRRILSEVTTTLNSVRDHALDAVDGTPLEGAPEQP